MAKKLFARAAVAVGFLVASSAAVLAGDEATYLDKFEGRWSGSGTFTSKLLGGVPLDCDVSGQAEGDSLAIRGQCRGSGVTTNVAADLRYEPKAKAYVGSWNDSKTGAARLAGSRRGSTLVLSVSGGEPRHMTLTAQGGSFRLSLNEEGRPLVNIAFQRG